MRRALAIGTITVLAASLPLSWALAHPCPCFPPGPWNEVELPEEFMGFSPEQANPVAGGVLTFGSRGEDSELDALLLTFPDPEDASAEDVIGVIPLDLPLPEGGEPNFLSGDVLSGHVLLGGSISAPDAPGAGSPFILFSSDGARSWQNVPIDDLGLDLLIDATPHADGFAISGAIDTEDGFRPAFTTFNSGGFGATEQLAGAQGFGVAIASGPGDDTLTIGGLTINAKGKPKPALFTFNDGSATRSNVPGPSEEFPIDLVTSGTDIVVTTSDGRVLHASEPGDKLKPIKSLEGTRIHSFNGEPDSPLLSFGMDGLTFSFDGGDSWAGTDVDGIAGAGTVKATGATPDGHLYAFSRDADGLNHLFFADGPLSLPIDPILEFAQMMAGGFVEDLTTAVGGVPTPEFVDEVAAAMRDVHDERQGEEFSPLDSGEPLEPVVEGATAREVAENFVLNLEAAGGSMPDGSALETAIGAIHSAYEDATGSGEE